MNPTEVASGLTMEAFEKREKESFALTVYAELAINILQRDRLLYRDMMEMADKTNKALDRALWLTKKIVERSADLKESGR